MNKRQKQSPGKTAGLANPALRQLRREFPEHPIVGVGGVIIDADLVLLVRRGTKPLKGEWSIPGGCVEMGERLSDAVVREIKEETGLDVQPLEVLAVADRIVWSRRPRRVRYHYVLVDYLCRRTGGTLAPATDVIDARWVPQNQLSRYGVAQAAMTVILRAFQVFRK